jgi:hypothetical protein
LVSHKTGGKTTGKTKWCHFAFDTEDAPKELHILSAAAHIPKERAVLSFLLAGSTSGETLNQKKQNLRTEKIRVISDSFPLKNNADKDSWGRYGCSEQGLVLVAGSRKALEAAPSGALEELELMKEKDAKSGAFMVMKK